MAVKKRKNFTGVRDYADAMSLVVSQRSTHGQARRVLVLKPDPPWPQILPIRSLERIYSSSCSFDSFSLFGQGWFVVLRELLDLDSCLWGVGAHHGPRVPTISNEDRALIK